MLPDMMDFPAIKSAIDMRADSFEDDTRGESPPAFGMSECSGRRKCMGEHGARTRT